LQSSLTWAFPGVQRAAKKIWLAAKRGSLVAGARWPLFT
jgi:hypothetical protein